MQHIHWALAPSLDQVLFAIIAFCVWTLVGALVMKYFVRHVPILNQALFYFGPPFACRLLFLF